MLNVAAMVGDRTVGGAPFTAVVTAGDTRRVNHTPKYTDHQSRNMRGRGYVPEVVLERAAAELRPLGRLADRGFKCCI
jgi:hypothetical protein